ncbi:MAG: hypothetical protein FJ215_13520 [Ignavibacteria bacterium]|nr:hypothetical protein [Ignavibacteria bacterium]
MTIPLILWFQLFTPNDPTVGFADALMKQGDYFRAITEYKRAMYHSTEESVKDYCLVQIAQAYRKSGKIESAVEYAAVLLAKPDVAPSLRYRANLAVGQSYFESNMPQLALAYFEAARDHQDSLLFPMLCLGVTHAALGNHEKGAGYFEEAVQLQTNMDLKDRYADFASKVRLMERRPRKSPALAGGLSAVVPGAGQLYSDHAYDAFQAFFYTASMAFATYAMYNYEHSGNRQLLWTYVGASITGIFYVSNVIGASRTAQYRNWKVEGDFTRELYDAIVVYEPR